ncbi:eCIS core domain-containing protein [Pantanalinema sp. GBBB05]|uniref:eCIS core domain-containing protein n=1 Tax=Pantanalinema sp. GBBB05 TaxID=2604139 RepID=UPI001E078D27|nr:DUF4157 domain-containing protein [Pantanalinema sp. GBBB05]
MDTIQTKTVNRPAPVIQAAASPLVVQRQAVTATVPMQVQTAPKVSSPRDPAEQEAEATAKKIMRMSIPDGAIAQVKTESGNVFRQVKPEEKEKKIQRQLQSPYITRFANSGVFTQRDHILRKAEGQPNVASSVAADLQNSMATGSPLPLSVRRFMEPRFRADFSPVKVHTGERSAKLNRQLNAQAFAIGNHIFFGKDKFKPDTPDGKELIAHEITHTVQQGAISQSGAAIQRREDISITQQSPPQVQRLGISDALDYFADKANIIPGFRMFTIILGVNPINMSRVERSAANILRAVIEFIPGGGLIVQALDNYGVFDRVGNWVEQQIRSLGMTGSVIREAINQFLDSLGWSDIFDLGGVWNRAKRIFTDPIDRIINFGKGLVTGIIQFIKDAILRPLARLAEGTRGYDLLKAVLGFDPITGDPVPRNADTLIGGFMKLIGQEEVWNNLKRANAVARAWTWFQGALSGLLGFVRQIPSLFIQAVRSLEITDIVLLPRAFARVGSVFAGFLGQFFSWAGQQVMSLLQIIFEVVAPGAMPYIRRAAGAFRSIIQNPIGFVGNLVRAGILGFRQFATNFLTHLRASLIGWLTGAMSGANLYIPQAFTLREIIKFVLSVLGLTWQNLRQKLVRVVGETGVRALETGFDLVMTLVTQGPAAAWEKIQESLSNLREMVMEQIMTFVRDRIVQAAITRLITSLNPAGAFIQAIIATYNTIMFFVERLRQIAQVAMSFIDSISAIASGSLAAAANRVEQTMAGLLTLVISFLARIAGLGRVSDAVTNIINRVRAPIDRALDRVIDWIVAQARRLGRFIAQAGVPQDPNERLRLAAQAAITAARRLSGRVTQALLTPLLGGIRVRYGLQSIEPYQQGGTWWVRATINPTVTQNLGVSSTGAETAGSPSRPISEEEHRRQQQAIERTRSVLRQLLQSHPSRTTLQSRINALRTEHRWSTLELQQVGEHFTIRGGFSPLIEVLEVDNQIWIVRDTNLVVPSAARNSWQSYENWVRDNVIRGSASRPGMLQQAAVRTGTATTQVIPPRPSGRTTLPPALPTGTSDYYREPVLQDRTRPDAVILSPPEVSYIEITLKADWAMLDLQQVSSARERDRINSQRVHKISQIPGHIFTLLQQYPSVSSFRVTIISDAAPTASTRAILHRWLSLSLFQSRNINVIWMIV